MQDCIFCKIVKGELPSTKVYEDDALLSIINIYPAVKGHLLVVPKEHTRWLDTTEDDLVSKSFILTKNLMIKMKANLSCDYVQIAVIGEEVPHYHIHLIPRMLGDENTKLLPGDKYSSAEEIQDYANKIKG